MTHAILIQDKVAATENRAYNRSAVCAADLDNGWLVYPSGLSTTTGESEVWTVVEPATAGGGSALTGLWVAWSPESVITVSGTKKYRGIDPDPRDFYIPATLIGNIWKPNLGDEFTVTADALAGTYIAGTTTHVNATNSTGGYKWYWGNSQTSSVTSAKLLAVTYVSVGTGGVGDSQHVVAYKFEVVGL